MLLKLKNWKIQITSVPLFKGSYAYTDIQESLSTLGISKVKMKKKKKITQERKRTIYANCFYALDIFEIVLMY